MRRVIAAVVLCGMAGAAMLNARQMPATGSAPVDPAIVERFLAAAGTSLASYRAVRHLEASARGGRMRGELTAVTSFEAGQGFAYEVVAESGSNVIRSKVLRAALEAERKASREGEFGRASLSEANYAFTAADIDGDGLLRVGLEPRRSDAMLIHGSLVLDPETADLLRVEGLLIKRPSFWTRRVHVTRTYGRILGVRVPVAMESRADVLLAGPSSFSMTYDYAWINGVAVGAN